MFRNSYKNIVCMVQVLSLSVLFEQTKLEWWNCLKDLIRHASKSVHIFEHLELKHFTQIVTALDIELEDPQSERQFRYLDLLSELCTPGGSGERLI